MNYPVWELTTIGGGSLIALISIIHVFISHLAVGGGIFLWLTDHRARIKDDAELNDFLRRYNWVFLLLTMVLGGVTGVGIWWTISLVSPSATSALIHIFVFAWAIEWVFFLAEIVALLVYHYYFDRLERRTRSHIAFYYAVFAWLSLAVINGILTFMLTPGAWLETGAFMDGFFNPGYIPGTLFRTFICVLFAGVFAFVVGAYLRNENQRRKVMRIGVGWLIVAVIALVPLSIWYKNSLPADTEYTAFILNPQMPPFLNMFLYAAPVILILGLLFILRMPRPAQKAFAYALILVSFVWMGGFEYIREIARKPYVIYGYMYSNGALAEDVDEINEAGILGISKWTPIHEVSDSNLTDAGREIFNIQCRACHSIDARNGIIERTREFTYLGVIAHLDGLGKVHDYMPPFLGTQKEKAALAAYITKGLNDKDIVRTPATNTPATIPTPIPEKNDEYVLLAWNEQGMRFISDCDKWFSLFPPGNTLQAQLIKRGLRPKLLTNNVRITYEIQEGFRDPAANLPFWDYADIIFDKELERNIGLAGNGLSGEFALLTNDTVWQASLLPVSPYDDNTNFNPYPLFTINAWDTDSSNLLASTKVVAPVSSELGCRNCHGGDWRLSGVPGISDETAVNILKAHDRNEDTTLYQDALNGQPRLCQSCHADPALDTKGMTNVFNFSAAIHGFHANYIEDESMTACAMCHPAYSEGFTRCYRGRHLMMGIQCTDCHGSLQEHALSLLNAQRSIPAAAWLAEHLEPASVKTRNSINPRKPWVNQPDCLGCHENFNTPKDDFTAFNKWETESENLYRNRSALGNIQCAACHGAPHAVYPAFNPYGMDRDNIQPLQYQQAPIPIGGDGKCTVCHFEKFEFDFHHPNTLQP